MPRYSKSVSVPGKSAQELYERVSQDIDRFLEKAGVGKFDIQRDPQARKIEFRSPMLSARLSCSDGSLSLDGQLSLLAAPFRSKIDEGIDRWIAKTFSS